MAGERTEDRQRITPRQREILELVAAGLSDKEIASRLRVSPRTVQSHIDRFFMKHDIHKRAHAVAYLLGKRQASDQHVDL